ncbi:hypothetical protein BS50DRAFT_646364 [Corynespora cassiicola Philippines]|uniref:C2H2-type domain-containing protein n=1 Tax=Corynespora cassiicola Philippines TaxID=1448308 RepID=A0A2T2NFY8_CORCC|nr:hypothetical protein BS50DRAFT_646364 [Corynespora cassiicola Philippines]
MLSPVSVAAVEEQAGSYEVNTTAAQAIHHHHDDHRIKQDGQRQGDNTKTCQTNSERENDKSTDSWTLGTKDASGQIEDSRASSNHDSPWWRDFVEYDVRLDGSDQGECSSNPFGAQDTLLCHSPDISPQNSLTTAGLETQCLSLPSIRQPEDSWTNLTQRLQSDESIPAEILMTPSSHVNNSTATPSIVATSTSTQSCGTSTPPNTESIPAATGVNQSGKMEISRLAIQRVRRHANQRQKITDAVGSDIKCNACNRKFTLAKDLVRHRDSTSCSSSPAAKRDRSDMKKKFVCTCGKSYPRKDSLLRHLRAVKDTNNHRDARPE